jgi:hypothetical protein
MQNFEINDAMANLLKLETSANFYNDIMSLFFMYKKLFEPKIHTVKYECLISNLKHTTTLLLDFLDLPWDENILSFQKTALLREFIKTPSYSQVTQNLYKHAVGRWKNYKDENIEVFQKLEPWVKEFQYLN